MANTININQPTPQIDVTVTGNTPVDVSIVPKTAIDVSVAANPDVEISVTPTAKLVKDYNDLDNKPQINGVTLQGNKTSDNLGLQDKLVSGTNIKTINGQSVLGSGDLEIAAGVKSVNGRTGAVVLDKSDVNLSNVDNTADIDKPISTATQTALNDKVDKVEGKGLSTNDFTNEYKANVDSNTAARHTHDNKSLLDTYNQTNTNLADAVAKKHEHANKSVLDGIDSADVAKWDAALQKSDVVDNVSSTAADTPLSANMGRNLQEQITHLQSLGRFLSMWNAVTGKPVTDPTTLPYTYHSGDYYRVGTITESGGTNYKPSGAQYTGAASTTVETESIQVGWVYYYDGSVWSAQPAGTTDFDELTNRPKYNGTQMTSSTNIPEVKTSTWDAKSTVSASQTGTSTTEAKYLTIDGTEYKLADSATEQTVTLSEDLYTYTNIGKITGASQTSPVKVASAGEALKSVFNAILGTEVDVNPTINQGGTTFTKSAQTGTTQVSGAEIGQSIASQTGTVTFKVTNTATCSYGLKAGSYDTYNKKVTTTFNYPIKTRTVGSYSYQVRISYPVLNGCTLSVTTGTLVYDDTTNKYLYCNVDASNLVTVSIAMPAGTSTASAQTRFGQLTADVEFDNATYNGVAVDNFWTYLKASYTASGMSHAAITGVKSTAYTITAGTRYAYSKVTSSTTVPTTSLTKQAAESTFHTSGADFSYSTGDYIYLYRTTSGLTVETFVLGQWAAVTATALPATVITQANGATYTYYPYRVGPMEATGSAKYRV